MKIELTDFEKDFLESLEDNREIKLDFEGIYQTIIVGGQKAGVVGFIPTREEEKIGFVQVVLKEDFRGLGIMALAEELLVKKYKLKTLLATIKKNNLFSIKAHEKAGFSLLDHQELENLRARGFLKDDELRFYRDF